MEGKLCSIGEFEQKSGVGVMSSQEYRNICPIWRSIYAAPGIEFKIYNGN